MNEEKEWNPPRRTGRADKSELEFSWQEQKNIHCKSKKIPLLGGVAAKQTGWVGGVYY